VNSRPARELAFTNGRPLLLLALLSLAGILLSIYVGRQEAAQYTALERLKIAEDVDNHFGAVQDYLAVRETVASAVSALFNPPPLMASRPLRNFGDQINSSTAPEILLLWTP
jgi:hypothetical protein